MKRDFTDDIVPSEVTSNGFWILLEKPLGAECLDISRVYYIFGTLD